MPYQDSYEAKYFACNVERTALRARVAELEALVRELSDDVEAEARGRYCDAAGELVHPAYERRFKRDMDVVVRARAALAGSEG